MSKKKFIKEKAVSGSSGAGNPKPDIQRPRPVSDDPALDRFLRLFVALAAAVVVLAMFPYSRDPAVDTKITLYSWATALVTIVLLWGRLIQKRPLVLPRLLFVPLAIFFGVFLVSGLLSQYVANSLFEISKFIPLLLLYFAASQLYRKPEHIYGLITAVCVAVGASILYGVFQHFGLDPFPWDPSLLEALKQAPGTFGNGNLAAHTTVLCISMAAYVIVCRYRFWYAYVALIFLLLLHMELARQRGGMVGLTASLVLVTSVYFLHKKLNRPGASILLGFGVLLVCGALAAGAVMAYKYVRTGVPYPTGLAITLRLHGYSGATRLIQERPILGVGPGNYRTEVPRFWTPFEQEHFAIIHRMNFHAHNDALEIGVEAGLPAAGLYLAILVTAIAGGLWLGLTSKHPGRRRMGFMFAAMFCTFLLDGFFGFNMRAAVSSMVIFLFAGALEGVWSAEFPKRIVAPAARAAGTAALQKGMTVLWVAAIVGPVLAIVAVVFQTCGFVAGMDFLRGRGAVYYKAYADADAAFAAGQSLAPWDWEFAFQRGEAKRMAYAPAEALTYFEQAMKQNPYFPPIYLGLAQCELMLSEISLQDKPLQDRLTILDDADKNAARALELCPLLPEAEDALGRNLSMRATLVQAAPGQKPDEAKKYWQEAETHFSRALELKAVEKDRIYLMLARTRMALNDKPGAREALQRCVDANPAYAPAWAFFYRFAKENGLQNILRESAAKAVARIDKSAEEPPPPGLKALAICWKREEGPAKAAAFLAEAAKTRIAKKTTGPQKDDISWAAGAILDEFAKEGTKPEHIAMPLCDLAIVYAAVSDWKEADKLFDRSINNLKGSDLANAAATWANVLLQSNQAPKAVTVLRDLIKRSEKDANLQLALARVLAKSGKIPEAHTEYEAVLKNFQLDETSRQMVQKELDGLTGNKPGLRSF